MESSTIGLGVATVFTSVGSMGLPGGQGTLPHPVGHGPHASPPISVSNNVTINVE